MAAESGVILALDIGTVRTGVARAHTVVGISSPLCVIDMAADDLAAQVVKLLASEQATALVVGLPRSLQGEDTDQTTFVRTQLAALEAALTVPIHTTDEALTSRKAEDELARRGKPFAKGDIDMLSACYILDDYLQSTGRYR